MSIRYRAYHEAVRRALRAAGLQESTPGPAVAPQPPGWQVWGGEYGRWTSVHFFGPEAEQLRAQAIAALEAAGYVIRGAGENRRSSAAHLGFSVWERPPEPAQIDPLQPDIDP